VPCIAMSASGIAPFHFRQT